MGPKKLAKGKLEVRFRKSGEVHEIPLDEAEDFVVNTVNEGLG